jgi:hypothetical protein
MKAQREAKTRLLTAFEAGLEFYSSHAGEMLAVIHRCASAAYPDKNEALEFVAGYCKARDQHDDFHRERKQ